VIVVFSVLQDVETSKLKLEKEFHNVQLEHKTTLGNLESAQKEIENLKHELKEQIAMSEDEKSFYKNQTTEIIWYALKFVFTRRLLVNAFFNCF
jgi:hypothetical protein